MDKKALPKLVLALGGRFGVWDAYAFLWELLTGGRACIIYHHRVAENKEYPWSIAVTTPQVFENQIRYMYSKYNIVALDELANYILRKEPLPKGAVAITFDDGYKDIYSHAYPILKKYSVPATVFLTTGHIGSGNLFWWDKIGYVVYNTRLERLELDGVSHSLHSVEERQKACSAICARARKLSEEEKNVLIEKLVRLSGVDIPTSLGKELILSWAEVEEMNNNGIAFGCHSVTHPIMTRVSLEQARYEIVQSKREIEGRLNKPVTAFAYPNGGFGDFNAETGELLREAGFACALTTIPRMITPRTSLYELGRIPPVSDLYLLRFVTSGLYSDLLAAYNTIRSVVHGLG